jgi:hypothetical protein
VPQDLSRSVAKRGQGLDVFGDVHLNAARRGLT